MMKKIPLFLLLILPVYIYSQTSVEKGLQSINKEAARQYIGLLASDSLEGRETGKRGAHMTAEYLKSVFKEMGLKPWKANFEQKFDASSGEDTWNKARRDQYKGLEMRNILGYIEGKNTDEVVIIGAHYDHVGIKSNATNDSIYNGADDNASGASAVLQVAKAFLSSGQQPERTVVFALWDAEEIGLVGSSHFVEDHYNNIVIPRMFPQTIKGYINCDMIGRDKDATSFNHVVIFATENNRQLKNYISSGIEQYKLNLIPEFRPDKEMSGGSDHMPFAMKGVPFIFYFTDLHPDYHQPTDHADRINYDKVVEISKSAFISLWNMANNKDF